jgi:hypothetical protein
LLPPKQREWVREREREREREGMEVAISPVSADRVDVTVARKMFI